MHSRRCTFGVWERDHICRVVVRDWNKGISELGTFHAAVLNRIMNAHLDCDFNAVIDIHAM